MLRPPGCLLKFAAYLIGIRVAELVQCVESLMPGVAGERRIADRVVRIAEVVERNGFGVAVADAPEGVECLP